MSMQGSLLAELLAHVKNGNWLYATETEPALRVEEGQ